MKRIRRCIVCGAYTLQETHCQMPSISAHPARYKSADPYARERRIAKGLL